jgi:superfamily II DNA or RNA helicase
MPRGDQPGGVLQAATGAGKTAMAAKLIQLLRTRTSFCVHTRDLMQQAQEMFEKMLGIEVGIIGSGKS